MGVWSSGTTYITFEDVKVPVSNIIGKENEARAEEMQVDCVCVVYRCVLVCLCIVYRCVLLCLRIVYRCVLPC